MKTIILCGGKGSRYDVNKSKVLAPIGNIPIIHHVINIYLVQGFKEFILATGWKENDIKEYFKSIDIDYDIIFVNTGEDTNTGGRIKLIEDHISKNDKNFFCTYADGVANIDLHKLEINHINHKNIATMTVVRPYNQFGIVRTDNNDQIESFEEKPRMNEYINGGFFVFDREIFGYIENNDDLEKQVFNRLIEKNKLGAFRHEGFWETLNTPKDEIRLNKLYNSRINNKEQIDWLNVKEINLKTF